MNSPPKRKKYEYEVAADEHPLASRLLSLVGRDKRVLEVGCASGSQTKAMVQTMNCSVVGIEIDEEAGNSARPYCEQLIIGDVEDLPLDTLLNDARFDVVLFADVLEHLSDPAAVLRKCRTFLSTAGCVIASVPNITHASVTFELAHGTFDYRDKGLLDDTHIRFFSRRSVVELFESTGYLVETLDRSIATPTSTEFATRAKDEQDRRFLGYIFDRNQEAITYQFLVRALPVDKDAPLSLAAKNMREQIESLEEALHKAKRDLNQVRSELDWLRAKPFLRMFDFLRQFFSHRGH